MKSDVLKRFFKSRTSVFGGVVLLIFIISALIGPYLCKYDPNEIDMNNIYQPISSDHWLGTDNLGRDTFSRLIHGSRISLTISFIGVFIGTVFGVLFGVCAGYFGGITDTIISRLVDLLLAFPGLLLAIAIVAILGGGVTNTMMAIAFYSIPYSARLVRGTVMTIKNTEYVQACKVMGSSNLRI